MGAKSDTVKTFLVELDCLLDTRLGTLEKINPSAAQLVYENPAYFDREYDDWATLSKGHLNSSQFEEAYAQRDVETLMRSRPTEFVQLLKNITSGLQSQKLEMPDVDHVKVVVNTYPYKDLTEDELSMLCTLVYSYCDLGTEVSNVCLSPEELTPKNLRDKWDGVVMYDFNAWFVLHVDALNHTLIPRNTLMAAALYIKPPESLKEEIPEGMEGVSAFAITEMSLIERLGLEFLSAKTFSIQKPA